MRTWRTASNPGVWLCVMVTVGCSHRDASPEPETRVRVTCVHPTRESVEDTLQIKGRLMPPSGGDLAVASQVPGRVVQMKAREGQRIARGDVVATIEDVSSRDSAHAATASLAQARALETNAFLASQRVRALVDRGLATTQELEDATARAEAAKASSAAAKAALDAAEHTLSRVVIQSSFAGTVSHVFRGVGALVDGTPVTPLIQLVASEGAEVVADVTESTLLQLREGMAASGSFSHGLEPWHGTVRMRSSSLDPQTGLGTIWIALATKLTAIPHGSFGPVIVALGRREGVLTLPVASLRGAVSEGSEVMVCAADKAVLRRVSTGYRDPQRVEIVSGLEPGEQVATTHVLGLENDTAIEIAK